MMQELLKKYESEFVKIVDHAIAELASIRTGRAHPALIENVVVETYGSRLKMREVASISTPEPHLLVVKPWDRNILKDIEKAILSTDLGLNPNTDSDLIRLALPELTQERREQLVKILHNKLEQSRIALRRIRDKAREEVQALERERLISEDDKFSAYGTLDDQTKEYILKVNTIGEDKEAEIRA